MIAEAKMKIFKKKKWKFNCENEDENFERWKMREFDCGNYFLLNEFLFV